MKNQKFSKQNQYWGVFIKDKNQTVFRFHSAHWNKECSDSMRTFVDADEAIVRKVEITVIDLKVLT